MEFIQHFIMVFVSLLILFIVLYMVTKRALQLRYALFWVLLTFVMVICAVLPGPLFELAHMLGFYSSSNFIFVLAIMFLLVVTLFLTAIVSSQGAAIKDSIQRIALLQHEIELLRRERKDNKE